MLKIVAETNRGRLLILGLSARNLDLLREHKPIDIDLAKELGCEQFSHVLLFFGETEDQMIQDMQQAGLYPPNRALNTSV